MQGISVCWFYILQLYNIHWLALVIFWWSPLDRKEIQPVHPKRNQSLIFIGRTDVEAETPILWPPDTNSWLIWKYPDAGKDWRWKEKGTTEDDMVGWHHWLNEHEFEWTPGVGDGLGGLVCCSPWYCKQSDMTEWLNWTEHGQWGTLPWASPSVACSIMYMYTPFPGCGICGASESLCSTLTHVKVP